MAAWKEEGREWVGLEELFLVEGKIRRERGGAGGVAVVVSCSDCFCAGKRGGRRHAQGKGTGHSGQAVGGAAGVVGGLASPLRLAGLPPLVFFIILSPFFFL